MKAIFTFIALLGCIQPLCAQQQADNAPKTKEIRNHYYSFSIPDDWEPAQQPSTYSIDIQNGIVPIERNEGGGGIYHVSALSWHTPGEFTKRIGLYVQSSHRLDDGPLSIPAYQKRYYEVDEVVKDELIESTSHRKQWMREKKSFMISAKTGRHATVMKELNLLQQVGNTIYHVRISVHKDYYDSRAGALMQTIINSFRFYKECK
jgi:hypothetical protein